MATVKAKYIIELNEEEALVLKKLLGGMTDNQFSEHGITGNSRNLMNKLWRSLPDEDE